MERLGRGALFSEWKKFVLDSAQAFSTQGHQVEVWHFSGIHPYTLEPIPEPKDRTTHLKFYWEAGHFKKALGDDVLSRIMREDACFGVRLRNVNTNNWLSEDRANLNRLLGTSSPLSEVDDILRRTPSVL
jgi:hypothetical protein